MTKQEVKEVTTFMQRIAKDHMDCGAVLCTELAECTIDHLGFHCGGEEVFDELCEIAYHVAVQYEAAQNATFGDQHQFDDMGY